ncbi:MAG: O-antigen ligase family protein [Nitrospirae bacterium]|nr:O-antigen ligase family protein [Nitrospirota bacterium]
MNINIHRLEHTALFCLCVLVFVLPIAHTITVRSFAIGITIAAVLGRYYLSRDFRYIKTPFELPFLLFFIAIIASLPTSVDIHKSLKELWREFLTPVAVFYTIYYAIKNEKDVTTIMKVLFIGSLIFSLYSFIDFHIHDGTWATSTYRAGGLRDPGGGAAAGLYHTTIIPFVFFALLYAKESIHKLALAALLIINTLALYITFTRASYLALGVEAFVILLLFISEKRFSKHLAPSAILVLISIVLLANITFKGVTFPTASEFMKMPPTEIALKFAQEERTGTGHRLAMWKTALDRISEEPFKPHGYGRFLFGRTVRNESNKDFIYAQVHNTFIGMAFELGLQGLAVFLYMILSLAFFIALVWKKTVAEKNSLGHCFAGALLAMMSGYWVNNFFGSFDAGDSKLLFMVLLGMGAALAYRLQKSDENRV